MKSSSWRWENEFRCMRVRKGKNWSKSNAPIKTKTGQWHNDDQDDDIPAARMHNCTIAPFTGLFIYMCNCTNHSH